MKKTKKEMSEEHKDRRCKMPKKQAEQEKTYSPEKQKKLAKKNNKER